jgi:molybdopterin converting factor subunit 1
MKATVLYFAAVRDLIGCDEETLDLPPEVTSVGTFASFLRRKHPELDGHMGHLRIAQNEVFAKETDRIADGDVLALIPPVAGG